MDTEITKTWWQSKTVWGGVVAAAAGLASVMGYKLSPSDQVQLIELITGVVSLGGGLVAVYGRFRASKLVK